MDLNNMEVVGLKALMKERGLWGYSRWKKVELITFLENNFQPTHTRSSPWEPIDDRPRAVLGAHFYESLLCSFRF